MSHLAHHTTQHVAEPLRCDDADLAAFNAAGLTILGCLAVAVLFVVFLGVVLALRGHRGVGRDDVETFAAPAPRSVGRGLVGADGDVDEDEEGNRAGHDS